MQYADRGSLGSLLDTQVAFPEEVIAYVLRETLTGLKLIHRKNQLHRGMSRLERPSSRYQEREPPAGLRRSRDHR